MGATPPRSSIQANTHSCLSHTFWDQMKYLFGSLKTENLDTYIGLCTSIFYGGSLYCNSLLRYLSSELQYEDCEAPDCDSGFPVSSSCLITVSGSQQLIC